VAEFRGEQVYRRACVPCHGAAGEGNGPAARYLDPRPRDFTSGQFKFRSTPDGELPTDADLVRTIKRGIPGTMMPSWEGLLTDQEIAAAVSYLKTFSEDFADFGPGASFPIPEEPETTPGTLAEGKNLHISMQCWTCHGVAGRGDGKSAGTLADSWGHKIAPRDFTTGTYKGGSESRSIFKTFYSGLTGTPMPSYADALLFAGKTEEDLSNHAEVYSESELEALRAYLDAQPAGNPLLTRKSRIIRFTPALQTLRMRTPSTE